MAAILNYLPSFLGGRPRIDPAVGLDKRSAADFKELWEGFVDAFVDTLAANGPASPPVAVPPDAKIPTYLPAVPRIVAIGDLHGDIAKMNAAFRLGGLIDGKGHWAGGTTVCVQVGDQLDRGGQEIPILYALERLKREAQRAGGRLYVINGNHESMNVMGRFRYANNDGIMDFMRWKALQHMGNRLRSQCGVAGMSGLDAEGPSGVGTLGQPRWAALAPGAPVTTRFLAHQPTVLQVGGTVFVHGGILPRHIDYGLQRINDESRDWMLGGKGKRPPNFLLGSDAVVWTRAFSDTKQEQCECDVLRESLGKMPSGGGAHRMVVGHTIQQPGGISTACDNLVFRIDVGMSEGCGNWQPEVIEILDDRVVRRLRYSSPAVEVIQSAAESAMARGSLHPSSLAGAYGPPNRAAGG